MRVTGFALLLLAACLLFAACGKDKPETGTEPTTAPVVLEMEDLVFTKSQVVLTEAEDGLGAPYALNKDLEITEFCGVTYGFEAGVSVADRESCIWVTESVRSRVAPDKNLQIYIYTTGTYDASFIKDGTVYTAVQDWTAPEYLAVLLQGLLGEYCHYGAAYGYGSWLGERIFGIPANLCDEDWSFSGDAAILDLNLLCFRGSLFDGKDVKTAKKLANTFALGYIVKNGEEKYRDLLIQSGEPEHVAVFNKALSDFHASRKMEHEPTDLLFRLGGKGYDYIIKCPYGILYIERDWKDRNPARLPMYYDGYLHQNYSQIIECFTICTRQMGRYQLLFGLDSYRNDLRIYYSNHYANGKNAVYVPNVHSVCSPYVDLTMCYIESLIQDRILPEAWARNGTITYFSWYYNHYGNRDTNYTANLESDHSALRVYREFRSWLGREIDIHTDFADFSHYYAATKENQDPNLGNSDSFVGYLVSRFGEKRTIDMLLKSHDFGGVTFEELVADWRQFLKENYGH